MSYIINEDGIRVDLKDIKNFKIIKNFKRTFVEVMEDDGEVIGTFDLHSEEKEINKGTILYNTTEIVSFDFHSIVLDNGGDRRGIVIAKMNKASKDYSLGFKVKKDGFDWIVQFKGKTIPFNDNFLILSR